MNLNRCETVPPLPDEVWWQIVSHLNLKEVASLSLVNKYFSAFTRDDKLLGPKVSLKILDFSGKSWPIFTKIFFTSKAAADLRAAEKFMNSGVPQSIKTLDLRTISFTDRVIDLLLKNFINLRTLKFSNTCLLKKRIEKILKLKCLTNLKAVEGQINDRVVQVVAKAIETSSILKSIELSGVGDKFPTTFGDAGASYLAEALKVNTTLTSLSLGKNSIGSQGLGRIAEALEQNRTLTKLNVEFNDIGAEGGRLLAETLEVNTTLTSLKVGHPNIGSGAVKLLVEKIEQNQTLKEVDLSYCYFDCFAMRSLDRAIKQNRVLRKVTLSHCLMTSVGIMDRGLWTNTNLTSFDLGYNGIDNYGARLIADALRINRTLKSFDLGYNVITDKGALHIAKALKVNTTIKWFGLSGCFISELGVEEIAEALASNKTPRSIDLSDQYHNRYDRRWGHLVISNF